ncbi:MAG: helix-turn-helix transcriptional regulator [Acidimicrobiales bacterium]
MERLTNLVTFLLHTTRPVTLAEVVEKVPGYPVKVDARRQAFERDKRLLRDERIPVFEEGGRYRIRPEDYYLPPLELAEDERVALAVAVAAVAVSPGDARAGLHKLGGEAATVAGPPSPYPSVRAESAALADLPALHAAARTRAVVGFCYADEPRSVEPWGLLFRDGHWYLVGHDRTRAARRTFRVDRIDGAVEVGPAGSFDPPGAFELATVPREPWLAGAGVTDEQGVVAVVRVDAVVAARVVAQLGERADRQPEPDGSVVLRIPITNREVFRSWVLGLLDHAEVIGPPDLRSDLADWLRALVKR